MHPQQSYLVCATPRSGSTLFCEMLKTTNIAGCPEEYFEFLKDTGLPRQPLQYFETVTTDTKASILATLGNPSLRINSTWLAEQEGTGYASYLAQVLAEGTTPNGVFGAKMMWGYLDDFLYFVRKIPMYAASNDQEILPLVFPKLQYIWIMRRDKARQAVSLWKAIQTQRWRKDQDSQELLPVHPPVFHFAAIKHLEDQLLAHEAAWQSYFAARGIQPFVVVYEDLVNHPDATIYQTLQYLSIPKTEHLSFTKPTMRRQADVRSEEWVQQYYLIKGEERA